MLNLDPNAFVEEEPLPRGWQFILLGADTIRAALREDGFPGLGVPMPDLGLPRLLLGGRTVSYLQDIPIGATLLRTSSIQSVTEKTSDAGPMAIVTIVHELHVQHAPAPAMIETQTYLLLPARQGAHMESEQPSAIPVVADHNATFTPDETLLFQYSALGFNSHKIHLDKAYARDVEGFPDLVVNGGLATLLLTEVLRRDLGLLPGAIKVRHIAPLFCGRPIPMRGNRVGATWHLSAFNEKGQLAIEMEAKIDAS
jgi:3-methylfumaryl-CoA hydratase